MRFLYVPLSLKEHVTVEFPHELTMESLNLFIAGLGWMVRVCNVGDNRKIRDAIDKSGEWGMAQKEKGE